MKIAMLIFLPIVLLLGGCATVYKGKEIYGADEFVTDSYKIREGKFSILEMEGKPIFEIDPEMMNEYKDTIHDGDILQIAIYHPKRKDIAEAVQSIGGSVGFRVMGGLVALPDMPPVKVSGLTLVEAASALQAQYAREIKDVEVFLTYKERTWKKVDLAGLVAISQMPVNGRLRLFDVLCAARVPPQANLFKSYVLRGNEQVPVDLYKLLHEGDMTQNIVMRGDDKIYIADPSASGLMVMGEVGRERVINLPTGSMSLRHALAEAGGIPFSGDKSYIQVIRGNIARPKIYVLNWEHVIHLPNDSLLLMPGDIVYVASKPITEWNRFISQLLPSFTGFEVVKKGFVNFGVFVP